MDRGINGAGVGRVICFTGFCLMDFFSPNAAVKLNCRSPNRPRLPQKELDEAKAEKMKWEIQVVETLNAADKSHADRQPEAGCCS